MFNKVKVRPEKELFDEYYRDTCKIAKEDMIAFMEANSKYEIKDTIQDTKARTLVIVGEKERTIMKKSANILTVLLSRSFGSRRQRMPSTLNIPMSSVQRLLLPLKSR